MNEDDLTPESNTSSSPPIKLQNTVSSKIQRFIGRFRLRTVITLSFVIVVFLAIGITGYLSFQNSQYAAGELASQLQNEISDRIADRLNTYLEVPHLINELCIDSIRLGQIDPGNNESLKKHFQELSYRFDTAEAICYAHDVDGSYTIISKVGAPGIANGSERFYGFANQYTNHSFDEYRITRDGELLRKTLSIPGYDPRPRPWYTAAVDAEGSTWTPIYMWLEGVVSIDAVTSVYSNQGTLIGVMDTAQTLSGIGEFLEQLEISDHGQAFIIEKSGVLVASSTITKPYTTVNGELVRLSGIESNNSVVSKTTQYVLKQIAERGDITSRQQWLLDLAGETQYVLVTPYTDPYGLEWLIVVVIPESDIMSDVNAHSHTTLLLLLCAILGTIAICIFLAGYITKPVLSMNQSAKALAKGDFSSWKDLDRQDELGELSHSFKQMADQLKAMISSLRTSEERYMSLFQSSADAILLCDQTVLLEMNRAGEEMFSVTGTDAAGKDVRELFGDSGTLVCEMIESSTSSQNGGYRNLTISRIMNENEQFLNIRVTKVPTDNRIFSLVHIRDITKERQAIITAAEQEALRESYSRVETILQLLPDPTFVINKDGRVLFWNQALENLTGHTAKEMIGTGNYEYSQTIHGSKRPVLIDIALHPDISSEGLYPYVERSGAVLRSNFWVEISGVRKFLSAIAAPLYDSNGEVTGAIESIRDVSSLKMTEEALLVANKKLNLLTGITRHDILNKIMISKAYLGFFEEGDWSEEQKSWLESINRALADIERFVEFSKTYQVLGLKVPVWQDVGEVFRQSAKSVEVGSVNITITISGIFILADPLFEKVCYNLIENAIRHGEHLTWITVSEQETSSGCIILVEDDGVGVPDDQKEMIFERGYGKNTGFGLFLAREILSMSDITIHERGKFGTGCRFEIFVPKEKCRKEE